MHQLINIEPVVKLGPISIVECIPFRIQDPPHIDVALHISEDTEFRHIVDIRVNSTF